MMLRLVIDTNVLLASVGNRSSYNWIWKAFLDGKFELCVSTEILFEYEEVFKSKLSQKASDLIIEIITESKTTVFCTPAFKWNLIETDQDDNKFADAAIQSKADYIITHDRHFDILKSVQFPLITVLNTESLKTLLLQT